ncbi:alanine/glycine:cation symporter family protein [Tepidibacter sp. Z1-5]|uniref:alanine/glycine:cation symporter family protein n=1 Tax=Tepidibacter sp. Z1-5 TaxID=3134138 RepID=UPI0030C4339A
MDLLALVKGINDILWGKLLVFVLCGASILFTFSFRFVQIRMFKKAFKHTFGGISFKGNKADEDGMSSFQALATAIAGQVGTGNLAGAATAIASGGPGAIFWMWLSAFFGFGTSFSEAVISQKYRTKVDGQICGGPAYYIDKGLNSKFLASFFAIAMILSAGLTGGMIQSNSIAGAFKMAFNVPGIVVGIVIASVTFLVVSGGISRIASVTEKLVPIMALLFIIGSLIIIGINASNIIPAFKMIFLGAFNPKAATGGLIGVGMKEAMRYGVARGLFSNEAGMGSSPHAHAVAKVNHPVEQGLVSIVGVFIDTFVILTLTALVILTTGALDGTTTGIELTQQAFVNGFGSFGGVFIAVSLFFFAFSTIIGWYFYGELNVKYLVGIKGVKFYKLFIVIVLVLGTLLEVPIVWQLADTVNGLMVIPNIIALVYLLKVTKASLIDFENKEKEKMKTSA